MDNAHVHGGAARTVSSTSVSSRGPEAGWQGREGVVVNRVDAFVQRIADEIERLRDVRDAGGWNDVSRRIDRLKAEYGPGYPGSAVWDIVELYNATARGTWPHLRRPEDDPAIAMRIRSELAKDRLKLWRQLVCQAHAEVSQPWAARQARAQHELRSRMGRIKAGIRNAHLQPSLDRLNRLAWRRQAKRARRWTIREDRWGHVRMELLCVAGASRASAIRSVWGKLWQ